MEMSHIYQPKKPKLHQLKGNRKSEWSIAVSGNWRVTFEFENGNAYVVNYEDYHS
jgi:toxin HigB-1